MKYGYARVSTRSQEAYGNGLDVQVSQLMSEGCDEVFSEAFTGTTMERPEWSRLMAAVKPGDTIVVAKLDRIARTSSGGFETVKSLLARGVRVHILNMGLIDDTPAGRLILNVMFAFAEFDRDMIVERMSEGKAAARQKEDYREGRPRIETPTETLLRLMAEEKAGKTAKQCAEELGVSERTYRRRKAELR